MVLIICSLMFEVEIEQASQKQKEEVNEQQDETEADHILLRISEVFYADIFLHHFLIQTRHANGNKHAAHDLFQEKSFFRNLCIQDIRVSFIVQSMHR